jgi:hypothetical protein
VRGYSIKQRGAYAGACLGLAVFFLLVGRLMVTVSMQRSSKTLAQSSLVFLTADSQVAIFNTYVPGLIFNLRLDRPVWVVNPEGRQTWMGSPYVSTRRRNPALGYDKVLLTFDQFADAWKKMTHPPLVFAKAKHVPLLEQQTTGVTQELVRVDEYVLVSKPEQRSLFETSTMTIKVPELR